ncbi:hypothetical protein B0A49_05298 [Cryomyces minteri]|uniref:Phospholipid/glycerol acyltransferase domain-containing protein n=1 Tax=Cryomyces minteri TaxID=331657 RepID=A0A4U0XFY7_9PEZI|nr:hypothetical protein B0A49_05298 [Cryomyces minteri]
MSQPPARGKALFALLRCIVVAGPWLAHLLVADLLLTLLLPLSVPFPTLSYNAASHVAASVWLAVQSIFTHANGAKITVSGTVPLQESAIVVSNHVEWADFYLIQALAIRAGMLGRCRWFAKQQLRWVPFLGWGLWAMRMPLVSRKWMADKKEMDRVFHGIVWMGWPTWLISYSEGTRFNAATHGAAVTWCKAHKKPILRHTLYPRTRGFIASVSHLRRVSRVQAVYDVTLAYAEGNKFMAAPTFRQTLFVPNLSKTWDFYVHVDRYPLDELPDTDEDLALWLEGRWVEKDARLESLREALARGESWETIDSAKSSKNF